MSLKRLFLAKDNSDFLLEKEIEILQKKPIPKHVAIIMDGNGRWAERKGLPRTAGHRQGVEVLREIIKSSALLGIKYLTLYAFSTENWKRPKTEVNAIMALLVEYLRKEIKLLHENNVKIKILGDLRAFPDKAHKEVQRALELTSSNTGLQVNVALNYGGRAEIVAAAKRIAQEVSEGKLTLDQVDEGLVSQYLYTEGIQDPDLLIRTGGDYRVSNFLLYQIAYTELWFTDSNIYWPDFSNAIYFKAISDYQNRQRRYGGLIVGKDE